jgi:hypothetical protein
MMSLSEIPHFEPWWFLMEFEGEAREWLDALREDFPEHSLIPFAKYSVYAEVACFDGTDLSGDPAVVFVDLEALPGVVGGRLANFDEWLEIAKEEAAEWAEERRGETPRLPTQDLGEVKIAPPTVPKR